MDLQEKEHSRIPKLTNGYRHRLKRETENVFEPQTSTFKRRHTITSPSSTRTIATTSTETVDDAPLMNEITYGPLRRRRATMLALQNENNFRESALLETSLPRYSSLTRTSPSSSFATIRSPFRQNNVLLEKGSFQRRPTMRYNDPAVLERISDRDKKIMSELNQVHRAHTKASRELLALKEEVIPNLKYEISKKMTIMDKLTRDLKEIDDAISKVKKANTETQINNDEKLKNLQLEQKVSITNLRNEHFEDQQAHEKLLRQDFEEYKTAKMKEIKDLKCQDSKELQTLKLNNQTLIKDIEIKKQDENYKLEALQHEFEVQLKALSETNGSEIDGLKELQQNEYSSKLADIKAKIALKRESINDVKKPRIQELEFKISQLKANLQMLNSNKDINLKLQKLISEEYRPRVSNVENLELSLSKLKIKKDFLKKTLQKEQNHTGNLQDCINKLKSSRKSLR